MHDVGEVFLLLVDVEQAREELLFFGGFCNRLNGECPVGGIVVAFGLLQAQVRAVVQFDVGDRTRLVVDRDLLEEWNVTQLVERGFHFFGVFVALRGTFVVVEGDAWADDVEHGCSFVRGRRLEQGYELFRVSGERACNESAAELDGQTAEIDRREFVQNTGFQFGTEIGGSGELTFGQTVDAVVFDDVYHRHIASDQVAELTKTDRCGVAVAGDTDQPKVFVCQANACRDRGHSSVGGVEAVGAVQEIGRRLAGTTDSAQFCNVVRLDAQFVKRFDDLTCDRVVSAAVAESGRATFVVRQGQTDAVCALGFGCRCNHVSYFSWLWMESVTKRASSGKPS